MSYTDGKHDGYGSAPGPRAGSVTNKHALGTITLAGNLTLTDEYRSVLRIDPDGSHRDVTLGSTTHIPGRYFRIINTAGGVENLVVKNADGDTIATINQNEQGEFFYAAELEAASDADNWVLICITAIALS